VLVVAGTVCTVLSSGVTGEVVGMALVTVGLGAAVLLVFLEVGLSEDRDRAREEARRRRRSEHGGDAQPRRRPGRRPRRPG
jgi:hypothetical protein